MGAAGSSSRLEQGVFYGLLALLVWMPIPLGSNRPWAWAILEAWAFLLAAVWLSGFVRNRAFLTPVFRKAKPVVLLLALWLLYLPIQVLPLPLWLVGVISPESARMHALAAAYGDSAAWATLSIDPHATVVFWLKSVAYVVIFYLILLLARSGRRVEQLALTFVFSGLLQTLYGAAAAFSGYKYSIGALSGYHPYSAGVVTGTYVNQNHLAGYLEMCLAIGIGLMVAKLGGPQGMTWRQRLRNVIALLLSPKARLRLFLVVIVVGLILTRSRMGNVAFFASLLITGATSLLMSRHATRSMVVLIVSLIAIDVFIVGAWFGVEKVAQRLGTTTVAQEKGKIGVYEYALEQWQDYPAVGAGAGSFYGVFPRYRKEDVTLFHDHVHNDYLELATETGVIGIGILGPVVVLTLVAALRAQYRRRNPLMRGMSFASIMGITAILIHSTVDFNLQIPANAATFMVLLGLGWISLFLEDAEDSRASSLPLHTPLL